MIIKTSIGKSFGGCCRYLNEKDQAQVLEVKGVRMESAESMTADFNYARKMNPDLGKAVWHASFSFAPEDTGKVSEELMKSIAKDYVDKFGFEQYAIIRHNDTNHEHFHLIANRVKSNGKAISDQYCAARGAELSKRLEIKYNLTQAKAIGKRIEKTNLPKLKGYSKAKYEIYQAISKELPKCKSMEDLQTKLSTHGIDTELHKHGTGETYGISFKKGQECFKGSEIDKKCSISNLTKTLNVQRNLAIDITPGLNVANQVIKIATKGFEFGM